MATEQIMIQMWFVCMITTDSKIKHVKDEKA